MRAIFVSEIKHTYPLVIIENLETNKLNGYIPDLAVFAEEKTLEKLRDEMQEILKNILNLQ